MVHSLVIEMFFVYCGLLRPGMATFHSLKSGNQALICQWLKYWITLAIFQILGNISNAFFGWLSFYDEMKLVLGSCVWLTNPYSIARFYEYFEPIFESAEPIIDFYIVKTKLWFNDIKKTQCEAVDNDLPQELLFEKEQLNYEITKIMNDQWNFKEDLYEKLKYYAKLLQPEMKAKDNESNTNLLNNVIDVVCQELNENIEGAI